MALHALKSSAASAASGFKSRLRHQRAFARAHLQVDGPMIALAQPHVRHYPAVGTCRVMQWLPPPQPTTGQTQGA